MIVANSFALIALAVCDGLNVTLKVYEGLTILEATYDEIVVPEKPNLDVLGLLLVVRVVKVDMRVRG